MKNVFVIVALAGIAVAADPIVKHPSELKFPPRDFTPPLAAPYRHKLSNGATAFLVNDAHATMHNMPPAAVHGEASYLSGRHKPLYMMEGLDASFDAAFFIAYHGSIGHERAILSHTYNPSAIWEAKLNGVVVG